MKKVFLLLAVFSFLFGVCGGTAFAYPQVFLKYTGVNPSSTGQFQFPSLGLVSVYYGEYDLAIDWDMGAYNYVPISGFCVEYATSSNANGLIYDLIPPSDLALGYQEAAYIFDQYLKNNITAQAAQIAIWEVVFDSGYNPTTGNGAFYANFSGTYVTEAANFISGGLDLTGFNANAGFRIAWNPPGSDMGTNYQNFIIPHPVPEPATMLLLGAGLVGLAGVGRKKLFKG